MNDKIKVNYRERHYIDRFRCYDIYHSCVLFYPWKVGGILYGYKDKTRINAMAFSDDDIISIENL